MFFIYLQIFIEDKIIIDSKHKRSFRPEKLIFLPFGFLPIFYIKIIWRE
jgi:hypothetical protein